MNAEPQKEHQWLTKLVGEWAYENDISMGPDKPVETFRGTETVRSIGGLWIVCEGRGDMQCVGTASTIMTLGYDPAKKRFVGSFIGSMMHYLWIYDGQLDASGNALVLDAEGPSFSDPAKMAQYKDVITLKSDDHRTLTSNFLGDDGKWTEFMTANYRRVK